MPATSALDALLRRAPHVMEAISAAAEVGPPDWLVGAGAIRDAVWDLLHGREPAPPRDVDLAFFDPDDLSPERERAVERALRARAPGLSWDAKNQAAVHLWYGRRFGRRVPPFGSSAEAVATFPEVASCVGVRRRADGELEVVAPYGLDDLLGCVCRHNPVRVGAGYYVRRVAAKGWQERWPRLCVLPPVVPVDRPEVAVMWIEAADEPEEIGRARERLEALVPLRGRRFLGAAADGHPLDMRPAP